MSSEPNRKIEDLLKRYAEQRKAESPADFELHPATRNLLQGEVTRTFSKEDKKKPWFFMLWPRIAIVGAFTAMLVVTVMVLNQPAKQEMELAQTAPEEMAVSASDKIAELPKPVFADSIENRALAKREVPPASPAPLTRSSATENEIAAHGGVPAIAANPEAKLSEPIGQVAPAKRRTETLSDKKVPSENFSADTFARASGEAAVAQTTVAPSLSAVTGAESRTRFYAEMDSQNRWHFVQQDLRAKYRRNLLSPEQPKILQSFEMTQTGNKIRLVESDGSIYDGEILAAAQDKLGEKDLAASGEQNFKFAFRALGTNQQLNRIVTFTGNFAFTNLAKENAPAGSSSAFQLRTLTKQKADAAVRIVQGKVSIGGTNEFEIRATTEW